MLCFSITYDFVKKILLPSQEFPDDTALFRAAIGEVQPMPVQNCIEPQKPQNRPLHRSSALPPAISDTLSDFAAENAPDEFLRNGISRLTLRKLRRCHWPIEDSLDLHGNTSGAARMLLQEFLRDASQHGLRSVLVIHGKGLNSQEGEAVLRKLARHWLSQHPLVLAFCNARPAEGGSGAVLVLLKVSS